MYFFFNETATTEIYTLSLHDALPICPGDELGIRLEVRCQIDAADREDRDEEGARRGPHEVVRAAPERRRGPVQALEYDRSEEHTSELQSRQYLVCRLLLEKKKTVKYT